MTKAELLCSAAKNAVGTDASPRNIAPQGYSCAESVTGVMRTVYPDVPEITYTPDLYRFLMGDPRFRLLKDEEDSRGGDIVVTPTTFGKARITGHTGIYASPGKIISTSGDTGILRQNYTDKTWDARWVVLGGMPKFRFRPVDIQDIQINIMFKIVQAMVQMVPLLREKLRNRKRPY